MPRFDPDFEGTRATTRVFDRCEAEVIVGEPVPFSYVRERDSAEIAGVRYPLTMAGVLDDVSNALTDQFKGEEVFPHQIFVHTDKAWRMAKQFLIAAYGFARNAEEDFNLQIASQKEAFIEGQDEEVTCGNLYTDCEGARLRVTLDIRIYTDPESGESTDQQQYRNWRPAS